MIYLLHFDTPYKHAKHYLGHTDNLEERMARHMTGRGARLIEVIVNAGITFQLVRTWEGGKKLERKLKQRKAGPRLCPLCMKQKVGG